MDIKVNKGNDAYMQMQLAGIFGNDGGVTAGNSLADQFSSLNTNINSIYDALGTTIPEGSNTPVNVYSADHTVSEAVNEASSIAIWARSVI